jgi:hypothetical protein
LFEPEPLHVALQEPQASCWPSSQTSVPHLMASPQIGLPHVPPAHLSHEQSLSMKHVLLGAHFAQPLLPPQSVSVSV